MAAHGQRVALTVSIGVAAIPEDRVMSAGALLELAGNRMQAAMDGGGNRVVQGSTGEAVKAAKPITLPQALELLKAGRPEAVLPQLAGLGQQVLPLLQLLNRELALDLPLAEIERRLTERARQ